jgi:uncharacterized protein
VDQHSVALSPLELAGDGVGFFRWGRIADRILLTNDAGDWEFLTESEFRDLLAGRVGEEHPRFQEFQRKGFVLDGLDLDALAARVAQRTRHMRRGPHLHVVTITGGQGTGDMSTATAEQVVDLALQSTSPAITFELQAAGGEPLLNFPVLRHLVETAASRNRRAAGKTLTFRLLSNFTAMTEEAAQWLVDHDVFVCTILDGPASVHDWNRKWIPGSTHGDVLRWIEHLNRRYREGGRDPSVWHVDAVLIATRRTIEAWREVVDEYVTRGMRSIFPRPLDPGRFAPDAWAAIGYTAEEYLDFYRSVLDSIVELNQRGVALVERLASIVSTKILTSDDPGIVDIQSPCGAGTGQIAYDVDGRVFPCDEARAIDAMGNSIFEIGQVGQLTIQDVVKHATVRAMAAASLLDSQPMCADCWNKPFCGFSPARNFATQGDLFGQRQRCFECKEHMAVSRRLFELIAGEGDNVRVEILERWAATRSRFATDARTLYAVP